jgi:ribonuclease HI
MTRINIYTYSGIKGLKKANGSVWYILECETGKGPATAGDKVRLEDVTGNHAELFAVLLAIRRVKKQSEIHIFTESQYVAAGFNWMDQWKQNGWQTKKGEPVSHSEEWQELDRARLQNHIEIHLKEQHSYKGWLESEARRDG